MMRSVTAEGHDEVVLCDIIRDVIAKPVPMPQWWHSSATMVPHHAGQRSWSGYTTNQHYYLP